MIVRATYPELTENHINPICAMLKCYHPDKRERLATYNDSKKNVVFPNGSRILFRYCDNEKDAERFQGTEVDILMVDEATHQSEERFKKLTACVRGVNGFPKRIYCTMNPGNIGHAWVKRLFIDKAYKDGENSEDYMFIQSLVTDNKALTTTDPDYVRTLEALPPKLRKAWLEGDWDIFEGMFFEEFVDDPTHYEDRLYTHVIEPFEVPDSWQIFRSFDWGYARPFSCDWFALDPDTGRLYQILQFYGCTGTPNEGVKWTADKVFSEIAKIEREHRWLAGKDIYGVADSAIWASDGGEAIIESAYRHGVNFVKPDKTRIAGWLQIHYRLAFNEQGRPLLQIFNTCKHMIRTFPLLQYSETIPEDLDTNGEDHCLAGDTQVLTDKGYISIQDLVGTEGMVMSHDGQYHPYYDVRLTRKQADIIAIELEDGTKIHCTDDHRFMLPNGEWIHAKELVAGMEVKTYGSTSN